MGDVISLEAYRKSRAAKPAPLLGLQKPVRKGPNESQRSGSTVKPVPKPVPSTEQDKEPPAD